MTLEKKGLLAVCACDLRKLNETIFRHLGCIVLDICNTNIDGYGLDLASDCGKGWVDVPRSPTPTIGTLLECIARSRAYRNSLVNCSFKNFDKRSLLFACNTFAPQRPPFEDSWTITEIITRCVGKEQAIDEVCFDLHPHGGYVLHPLPAWCSKPSNTHLYQAYVSLVKRIKSGLDIKDWKMPTERELLTAVTFAQEPKTVPEMIKYCSKLGFR